MRKALTLSIAILGLAACAGVGAKFRNDNPGCQMVYGACVLYASDAPASIREHMAGAFEAAATHWGDKPDAIKGWTVVVHGYGPTPFFPGILWGITFPETRRVDFWQEHPLCPEVVFVHEWGHAAHAAAGGDGRPHESPTTDDPRFDDNLILAGLRERTVCR